MGHKHARAPTGRQTIVELDGRRTADVIGAGFVREAEHTDPLLFEDPEGASRLLEEDIDSATVYVFSRL